MKDLKKNNIIISKKAVRCPGQCDRHKNNCVWHDPLWRVFNRIGSYAYIIRTCISGRSLCGAKTSLLSSQSLLILSSRKGSYLCGRNLYETENRIKKRLYPKLIFCFVPALCQVWDKLLQEFKKNLVTKRFRDKPGIMHFSILSFQDNPSIYPAKVLLDLLY